jgi:hypothetical protein
MLKRPRADIEFLRDLVASSTLLELFLCPAETAGYVRLK